jgi:hypothetical protein
MPSNTLLTPIAFIEITRSTNDQTILSTDSARIPFKHEILHASISFSYKFPKESDQIFPLLPVVIRLLTPNDIMHVQLTIVSTQCFMHYILRAVQNTTLNF